MTQIEYELKFTEKADQDIEELKNNPSKKVAAKAVIKTLKLMRSNLKHPSLNTHKYDVNDIKKFLKTLTVATLCFTTGAALLCASMPEPMTYLMGYKYTILGKYSSYSNLTEPFGNPVLLTRDYFMFEPKSKFFYLYDSTGYDKALFNNFIYGVSIFRSNTYVPGAPLRSAIQIMNLV